MHYWTYPKGVSPLAVLCRIDHVTKVYRGSEKKANDDLTFEIQEGEIFGLLGPNGAGKSTLVNQIAGQLTPTAGRIHLYGIDTAVSPELVTEYVALQPQFSSALWDLFPEEAIYYTGRFRGMTGAAARQQTDALMEELALNPMRRQQMRRLSGGQRRLVHLAIAMVANRPVLIFDEPTNELDPVIRRRVWDRLLQLNREGRTIILVTHNVLEAERVVQRVGIINHGRLIALGTPGELKSHIDSRVRLELLFKAERSDHGAILTQLGEARALSRQHWMVLCHREQTRDAIDRVLAQIGLDSLDDFRILTPSLEDVYLQLGGGERLG